MVDLVIFHYHLLPGGVTDVIIQGVMALAQSSSYVKRVTLVCGRQENTEKVRRTLTTFLTRHRCPLELKIRIMPEIDYLNHVDGLTDIGNRLASLEKKLTASFASPDAVWWVHNYQLGKNPLFSEVLLRIIASDVPQNIILQIHDFPEAGRPSNLQKLKAVVTHPLYPVSPRVRYLVINSRDDRVLREAGIPSELVYLVDNPMADFSVERREPGKIKKILAAYGRRRHNYMDEHTPLVIYPIRAIRRKNVLEAGLLTRLLPGSPLLLVTLPGVSESEREYSAFVSRCFAQELIPGFFGIGLELDELGIDFPSLLAACDLMCCSSVQEGFGYPYLQALLLGVPLLARRLDVMDGFIRMFDHYPGRFYSSLLVPVEPKDKSTLKDDYLAHISSLTETFPPALIRSLTGEVEQLMEQDFIDFSFLSFRLQLQTLKEARSPVSQDVVRDANPQLFTGAGSLLSARHTPKKEQVLGRFGLKAYAESLDQVLRSFSADIHPGPVQTEEIDDRVLRLFGSLQNLRLLFAPGQNLRL